jgi:hypothetical protein
MSKSKEIIKTVGDFFRGQVLAWLRKWVLDWLLKKILGTAIGGVWGWLATFFFDIAWKKWIVPLWKTAVRKGESAIKKPIYKKKAEKLEDAKTKEEFDSAVDNLP